MNKTRIMFTARNKLRSITQLERITQTQLEKEFNRAINSAASAYPNWKSTLKQHQKNLKVIAKAATLRSARVGMRYAKANLKSIETKLDSEDQLSKRLSVWAENNAADLVTNVSATTKTRIANAVAAGIGSHLGENEIAKLIRERVGSMSGNRARTIARTESHRGVLGAEHIQMEDAADQYGMDLFKTWVATEDARTRESHTAVDGKRLPIDEPFKVGESELMYPGDPDGDPEETINCRCLLVWDSK